MLKKKTFNFENLAKDAKMLSNLDIKNLKGGIGDDDIEVSITNTDMLEV